MIIRHTLQFVFLAMSLLHLPLPAGAQAGKKDLPAILQAARERLEPYFHRQRVDYPPPRLKIVVIKNEERVKLYAPDSTGDWRFLAQYPATALSGTIGPKLREGDLQVPEGRYRVTHLNPDSKFHLSLALNYPNDTDRRYARQERRRGPFGKDIMIHGNWFSTGCVAVGDTAAEDIYTVVKDTGLAKVSILLSPADFRNTAVDDVTSGAKLPRWAPNLYGDLKDELEALGDAGSTTHALLIRYPDSEMPPDLKAYLSVKGLSEVFSILFAPPEDRK